MPVFVTFAALGMGAALIVARPLWALTVLMLVSALLALQGIAPQWAAGLIAQSAEAGPLALLPLGFGAGLGYLIRRREMRRG